jgi:hypothetical protein
MSMTFRVPANSEIRQQMCSIAWVIGGVSLLAAVTLVASAAHTTPNLVGHLVIWTTLAAVGFALARYFNRRRTVTVTVDAGKAGGLHDDKIGTAAISEVKFLHYNAASIVARIRTRHQNVVLELPRDAAHALAQSLPADAIQRSFELALRPARIVFAFILATCCIALPLVFNITSPLAVVLCGVAAIVPLLPPVVKLEGNAVRISRSPLRRRVEFNGVASLERATATLRAGESDFALEFCNAAVAEQFVLSLGAHGQERRNP